jgi:hypothetical protein
MASHMVDNGPYEDTGISMQDKRISAEQFIERLSVDAMKFRTECQGQIERAKQDLAYWQAQYDIVTNFLVKDQLAPVSGPAESITTVPLASRMRREMEN